MGKETGEEGAMDEFAELPQPDYAVEYADDIEHTAAIMKVLDKWAEGAPGNPNSAFFTVVRKGIAAYNTYMDGKVTKKKPIYYDMLLGSDVKWERAIGTVNGPITMRLVRHKATGTLELLSDPPTKGLSILQTEV